MAGRRGKRESRAYLNNAEGVDVQREAGVSGGVTVVINNGGSKKSRLCCCRPKIGCLIAFICIQMAFMVAAGVILIIFRTRDRRLYLVKYCVAAVCFFDVFCDVLAVIALARKRHRYLLMPWFGLNCIYFAIFCLSLLCPLFLWWYAMLKRAYRCIKTDFGYRYDRDCIVSRNFTPARGLGSAGPAHSETRGSLPTLVQYPPTMPHAFVPHYIPSYVPVHMNVQQQQAHMIPMQQMPAHQMYGPVGVPPVGVASAEMGPSGIAGPQYSSMGGYVKPSAPARPPAEVRPPKPPPPYTEYDKTKLA